MKYIILAMGALASSSLALTADAKSLRIENKRAVALTELVITTKNNGLPESFVLAQNLAAGRAIAGAVPRGKCLFDVKGIFADQSTLAADDMDLCSQRTIRLVK